MKTNWIRKEPPSVGKEPHNEHRASACRKVGAHRLAIVCFAATAAFIVAFALGGSLWLALAMAMLLAVASDLFYPSTVALGMSYLPRHLGTASGLSYGVAICMGGIAEPFLGMAGDAVGLVPVMLALACVAAVGTLLTCIVAKVDTPSGAMAKRAGAGARRMAAAAAPSVVPEAQPAAVAGTRPVAQGTRPTAPASEEG